mgnify:CR=1 FL=1
MTYADLNLKTPATFENTSPGSRILIVASGHSTGGFLQYKEKARKHFDVIIACNYAFEFVDDIIDFHIVTEKTSRDSRNTVHKILAGDFRTDVPRIVNWKGIELYPKKYNLFKTTRANFDMMPNIYKYNHNGQEGLLIGPAGKQGFALGSVSLSALHFAVMLGAVEVYMVGADMCFKDQYDHFYKDRIYRDRPEDLKKSNAHNIINVELNGQKHETTEYFKESAEHIDKLVPTLFKDIKVFDFSNGLLTTPIKLNIEDFFKEPRC